MFLRPSAAGNLSGGRLAGRLHWAKICPPPLPPAFCLAAKCLFIVICFHPLMARRRNVSRAPLLSLRILFFSSLPPSVPSARPLLRLSSWRREKGFGDPPRPQSHLRRMRRLLSSSRPPPPFFPSSLPPIMMSFSVPGTNFIFYDTATSCHSANFSFVIALQFLKTR